MERVGARRARGRQANVSVVHQFCIKYVEDVVGSVLYVQMCKRPCIIPVIISNLYFYTSVSKFCHSVSKDPKRISQLET